MIPLTKKEDKWHNKQKLYYICKKRFSTDYSNKRFSKVKDIEVLLTAFVI